MDDPSPYGLPGAEQVDGRPLIWRIREYEDAGLVATVTFAYDARGRLLSEQRTDSGSSPVEYSLAYEYDALGNRLVKTDYQAGRTTFYHYDVHEAVGEFASHNNRLQWYRVYNGVFVAEPEPTVVTPLEEVMYVYDAGGQPVVIARKTDGDPVHDGLRLVYSAGGQLWLVISYYVLRVRDGAADNQETIVCADLLFIPLRTRLVIQQPTEGYRRNRGGAGRGRLSHESAAQPAPLERVARQGY